jgi:hypothetical protein
VDRRYDVIECIGVDRRSGEADSLSERQIAFAGSRRDGADDIWVVWGSVTVPRIGRRQSLLFQELNVAASHIGDDGNRVVERVDAEDVIQRHMAGEEIH